MKAAGLLVELADNAHQRRERIAVHHNIQRRHRQRGGRRRGRVQRQLDSGEARAGFVRIFERHSPVGRFHLLANAEGFDFEVHRRDAQMVAGQDVEARFDRTWKADAVFALRKRAGGADDCVGIGEQRLDFAGDLLFGDPVRVHFDAGTGEEEAEDFRGKEQAVVEGGRGAEQVGRIGEAIRLAVLRVGESRRSAADERYGGVAIDRLGLVFLCAIFSRSPCG